MAEVALTSRVSHQTVREQGANRVGYMGEAFTEEPVF